MAGCEYDSWTQLDVAGHYNDQRIEKPEGIYIPPPESPGFSTVYPFWRLTPVVHPDYVVALARHPELLATDVPQRDFWCWWPPFHRSLQVQVSDPALAAAIDPGDASAWNNVGAALARRGQIDEAIAHYQRALEINPDYADAHDGLGQALLSKGRVDEAITHFRKVVAVKPDFAEAHNNLGAALAKSEGVDEAMVEYQKALEIDPNFAQAHNNLGFVLARRGRLDEARVHFQKALELKPDYANARNNLGIAESQWEEIRRTLAGRRELLRAQPDDVALLNETAWTLATNPNASIRNGAEAIELAERTARLSDRREPAVLGTLAAAYAEAGRFPEAVETAPRPCNWPPNRASSRWRSP